MNLTESSILPMGKADATASPTLPDYRIWLPILPLLALTAIAFFPALANGWVDFDDDFSFTQNPNFGGISWAGVRWAFTDNFEVYQPLGWLVWEAQASVWGLQAWGYHLVSLVFHAINLVVLYFLIIALLRRVGLASADRPWPMYISSALAAGLFAVHPLRVEPVAWITCQSYLPCVFFGMLTVLAYLRTYSPGRSTSKLWWLVSLLCFFAAVLCKAPAVTLPMVLLILDVWVLGRINTSSPVRAMMRCALEKLPFFVIALAFSVIAFLARRSLAPLESGGLVLRLEWACSSVLFYLGKTVLPFGLAHIYCPDENPNWYDLDLLSATFAVVGITAILIWQRQRWPGVLAAWLSYLVILSPTSGLFRNDYYIAADRYSYLSMIGLVVLAAGVACACCQRLASVRIQWSLAALGCVLALGCSLLSRQQCRVWHDTDSLWNNGLQVSAFRGKDGPRIKGEYLLQQGKYEQARQQFEEVVRAAPGQYKAHINLGITLSRLGRESEADESYAAALRLAPHNAKARADLAVIYLHQKQFAKAVAELEEALVGDRNNPVIHHRLGLALIRLGRPREAEPHLRVALKLQPRSPEIQHEAGFLLEQLGDVENALRHYKEAARLQPDYVEAQLDMGLLLLGLDRVENAEEHLQRAVRLRPDNADAQNGLGSLRARQGRLTDAAECFAAAARLQPKNAKVHYNLGLARLQQGDWEQALATFRVVLELDPNQAAAKHGQAVAIQRLQASKMAISLPGTN